MSSLHDEEQMLSSRVTGNAAGAGVLAGLKLVAAVCDILAGSATDLRREG